MMFKLLYITVCLFSAANAQYAQLSSKITQTNGELGVGTALTYDSIDAIAAGISFTSGDSKITVGSTGAYFVMAAPQVGYGGRETGFFGRLLGKAGSFIADYYVVVNGVVAPNSNVRIEGIEGTTDVIVTQGVYVLNNGDQVEIFGSGVDSICEYIQEGGEPDIPSIITTIYKL